MKVSVSFLSIEEDIKNQVEIIDKLNIDFIHLDIMDGMFTDYKTYELEEFKDILINTTKPKDVHLMVKDVKKYIDLYSELRPIHITVHYEAIENHLEMINYIKSKGIKAGISIKPNTEIEKIKHLLEYVDLVLVMSVEPGMGGQKFLDIAVSKIYDLYDYRNFNNYQYMISVDGGITDVTKKLVEKADIIVVGAFITSGNYEEQLRKLKNDEINIVAESLLFNINYQHYIITKFVYNIVKNKGNHLSEIEIYQLMFEPNKFINNAFSDYEVKQVKNICEAVRYIYSLKIENKLELNTKTIIEINKIITEDMIEDKSIPKFISIKEESEEELLNYILDIKNIGNVFYYIGELIIAFYMYKPFKMYNNETLYFIINLHLIKTRNAPITFNKETENIILEYVKNKDKLELEKYLKKLSEEEMNVLKKYL